MKRFFALLLAVLLCTAGFHVLNVNLSAAAEAPESAAEASPPPAPAPTPTPTPTPAPTPTPTPTPEPTPEPSPEPTPTPKPGYYLKVNVEANTVTAYTADAEGEYTVPVRAMVCSTGEATPLSGVYTLGSRYEWRMLFGGVCGQYACRIVGNILFHSVPYQRMRDKGSLEYWEYDKLGTSCSMGCVRLQVKDAKWIYDHCDDVVAVEFYSSPDPGPLGKPVAPSISLVERCRGWDPTDPDPDNPWLKPQRDEGSEP